MSVDWEFSESVGTILLMKWIRIIALVLLVGVVFWWYGERTVLKYTGAVNTEGQSIDESKLEIATFAAGCFWCVETPFEHREGVVRVVSGYAGGSEENPTYEEVASGETGHREAVQVWFDPSVVSYAELVELFGYQFDPTDAGGSFVDRGFQYTSAIWYRDEEQRVVAEKWKADLEALGKFSAPIVTVIAPFTTFYEAEDYHQDYYKKNPLRYKTYRYGSGRDQFIEQTWGEAVPE